MLPGLKCRAFDYNLSSVPYLSSNDSMRQTRSLAVFLRSQITLAWANRPVGAIKLESQTYRAVGPEWSGFYDWLCDADGRLVAIRYEPCGEVAQYIREGCELGDYAEPGKYGDWTIYLGERRALDPAKSEEQDFLYDQVLVAADGSCVIVFANNDFTKYEQAGIGSSNVTWVALS